MKKILLSFLAICALYNVHGQDIHYSQFFNSPLNINPALTGVMDGEHRFIANYKSQWTNVPVDYLTFSAAYDKPLTDRLDSTGYFGIGALLNFDRAGFNSLQNMGLSLSASYNYYLNEKWMVSPGLSFSFYQRGFDFSTITSGNQWNGFAPDFGISPETFDNDTKNYIDVSPGLNLRYRSSFRTFVDFGGAFHHLLQPVQGFNENSQNDNLESRLSLYAMSSFFIADRFDLLLNGLYSTQDVYNELVLNAQGKIYLNGNNERNTALFLGVGLRQSDAWYPMVGIQKGRWYISGSFDFNISDFEVATDGSGGLELHARYLFTKVPVIPIKPCPIY